jgi:hypothetical protein
VCAIDVGSGVLWGGAGRRRMGPDAAAVQFGLGVNMVGEGRCVLPTMVSNPAIGARRHDNRRARSGTRRWRAKCRYALPDARLGTEYGDAVLDIEFWPKIVSMAKFPGRRSGVLRASTARCLGGRPPDCRD